MRTELPSGFSVRILRHAIFEVRWSWWVVRRGGAQKTNRTNLGIERNLLVAMKMRTRERRIALIVQLKPSWRASGLLKMTSVDENGRRK